MEERGEGGEGGNRGKAAGKGNIGIRILLNTKKKNTADFLLFNSKNRWQKKKKETKVIFVKVFVKGKKDFFKAQVAVG